MRAGNAGGEVYAGALMHAARRPAILGKAAGRPTLTVSETPAFVTLGDMVMLFTEGTRVRFSINEPAVRANGLHMSSLLLNLSRTPPPATRRDEPK